MTNKQIQTELNKVVEDINTILMGKQCKTTGQYEFKPLLMGFRPDMAQMTIFGSDVIMFNNVYIDKCELHSKTLIIERTINACDYMIDTLKTHVDKLERMLTPGKVE